jgi:hypothetical protein
MREGICDTNGIRKRGVQLFFFLPNLDVFFMELVNHFFHLREGYKIPLCSSVKVLAYGAVLE